MNVVEGLQELEVMRSAGTLSNTEFAQAKVRLLSEHKESDASHQLAITNLKMELDRIDREWAVEREKYVIVSPYGLRRMPEEHIESNRLACGICMVCSLAIGIQAVSVSFMYGRVALGLGVLGCLVFVGGIWGMVDGHAKEEKYEEAKTQYVIGRAEVERQLEKAKRQITS